MRWMPILCIMLFSSLSFSNDTSISETSTQSEETDTLTNTTKTAVHKDIVISVNARQDSEYSHAVLQDKLKGYTRMHTAGVTMMVVGFPLTAVGIACFIAGVVENVNSFQHSNNGDVAAGSGLMTFGQIAVGIGPEMGIAGVVLTIIGGKKQREYQQKLNLKVGLNSMKLELAL